MGFLTPTFFTKPNVTSELQWRPLSFFTHKWRNVRATLPCKIFVKYRCTFWWKCTWYPVLSATKISFLAANHYHLTKNKRFISQTISCKTLFRMNTNLLGFSQSIAYTHCKFQNSENGHRFVCVYLISKIWAPLSLSRAGLSNEHLLERFRNILIFSKFLQYT